MTMVSEIRSNHPKIGDAKFRVQLALKNVSVSWNFYCSPKHT